MFVYQQDNARPYTALFTMNELQVNTVNTLTWPSRSPGLATIEHVFDILQRRIRRNHHPLFT